MSTLGLYRALLRTPGAAGLVATSLLARMSFGLVDVALVVLVQRQTGSFALAGVVVGANAAGIGATSPLRGRGLDRLGARRLLPPMAVVHAAGIGGTLALAHTGPRGALVAAAFLTGALTPPLVPAMRLEWQRLLGAGTPELERAYAFETSAQIAVFLVGPLLAAAGLALLGPEAPISLSIVLMLVGTPLFARRARTQPDPDATRARGLGAIKTPGVRALVAVTLLADAALGIVDVSVIATATERGHPALGGVLLAAFTTGAVVGGALYGVRTWTGSAHARLRRVLLVFAVALGGLAAIEPLTLLGFTALLLVAGAPSAAQWTTTSVALDDVAPAGQGAEAYTWLSSANAAGIAVGGAAAGAIVDAHGAAPAYAVAAGLAVLAAAAAR